MSTPDVSEMAALLARYGETNQAELYVRYREMKRDLYDAVGPDTAEAMCADAAEAAGWDEGHAEAFSRLS